MLTSVILVMAAILARRRAGPAGPTPRQICAHGSLNSAR
jgi:hypothetical protein